MNDNFRRYIRDNGIRLGPCDGSELQRLRRDVKKEFEALDKYIKYGNQIGLAASSAIICGLNLKRVKEILGGYEKWFEYEFPESVFPTFQLSRARRYVKFAEKSATLDLDGPEGIKEIRLQIGFPDAPSVN